MIEDKQDFNNAKAIVCESKLAMLLDSQTPPFALEKGAFTENGQAVDIGGASPAHLFKWLIEKHNEQVEDWQQFALDEEETTNTYTIDGEKITKTTPKFCTVIDDTVVLLLRTA